MLFFSYFLVPAGFTGTNTISNGTTSSTLTNVQLVQKCMAQDITKQPVIIDVDTDIDDLWAIHYLINVIKSKDLTLFSI